jgi:AraC-like DNA-binding protein
MSAGRAKGQWSRSTENTPDIAQAASSVLRFSQRTHVCIRRVQFDSCLIVAVDSGSKTVKTSDVTVSGSTGSLVVLPPARRLDITNIPADGHGGEYRARVLALGFDAKPSRSSNTGLMVLRDPAVVTSLPSLMSVFDRVHQTLEAHGEYPAAVRDIRVQELSTWLELLLGCRLPLGDRSPQPIASQLRRLLRQDLAADWDCLSVAAALAMSEATLRRKLRSEGTSFAEELLEVRMSHALQLLQAVDGSIETIAATVGYASPSRFAERFKERFDVSPSVFRKSAAI